MGKAGRHRPISNETCRQAQGRGQAASKTPPQWPLRALAAALASLPAMAAGQSAGVQAGSPRCNGADCVIEGRSTAAQRIDAHGSDGKNGSSSWINPKPGNGGDGAAGQARNVRMGAGASVQASPPGAAAVLVRTDGGAGGKGEHARIAHDGLGGNGGAAGAVSARIEGGTVSNTSQFTGSHAVHISARGGRAGDSVDRSGHPGRGNAGAGGRVLVQTRDATLTARGPGAHALFVDASGGDGGEGRKLFPNRRSPGGAGGAGGAVDMRIEGGRHESGAGAASSSADGSAIRVRTAGGDGGNVAGNLVGSMGAGGTGGSGGSVAARILAGGDGAAQIRTSAARSDGVQLLSAGGQGGEVGNGVFSGGAAGGAGGRGGAVSATIEAAQVETAGAQSAGIRAESRGGDGFWGGASTFARGGKAGRGGDGGNVAVETGGAGSVATRGAESHGVVARSLGGNGHNGGRGGLFGSGGSGSAGGAGGTVRLVAGGQVRTQGEDAFGVYGASIGGHAGDGGRGVGIVGVGGTGGASSRSGRVEVLQRGHVETQGRGAHAMVAQSIGGGGGAVSGTSGQQGRIGGLDTAYSDGAHGADVIADNSGTLRTRGQNAFGLLAQSIGGGGGNGGAGLGLLSIGGDGQVGGSAAGVRVTHTGDLLATSGDGAAGIVAQSIGGGGGNGGSALALGRQAVATFSLGGRGKAAGDGGQVQVTSRGGVLTEGRDAAGILAQSIGGGGGNGGSATSLSLLNVASVAVGGSAGSGGIAGAVKLDLAGTIQTRGHGSNAVMAQSIGGGGGNGGNAVAGNIGLLSVALGGSGGGGASAGAIDLVSAANVATQGADAIGLLAQSIGGGGGSGGRASAVNIGVPTPRVTLSASVALGGKAGSGGAGRDVTLQNRGRLETHGLGARGIVAQSVGGGGGVGGSASATSIAIGPEASVSLAVALGRSGGSGGDAGRVSLSNTAGVATAGRLATALTAQSVGGGGGLGGAGATRAIAFGQSAYAATVALGGAGGQGGHGGAVTVNNEAGVATRGAQARGVLAQSVGGGGGDAGLSDGDIKADTVSVNVTLGRAGGSGGNGGAVSVRQGAGGSILTLGRASDGLLAQSIGGGGGVGGVVGTADTIEWPDMPTPPDEGGDEGGGFSGSLALALGGRGGSGGDAGVVDVAQAGTIRTRGHLAAGVIAQSIGGGGGRAGSAKSSASGGDLSVNVTLGRSGGSGGLGGNVSLENAGRVQTEGQGASALLAQSVGGGGGAGGAAEGGAEGDRLSVGVSVGGGGGRGGDAGTVRVRNRGTVLALAGDGLVAQSIGGGGGEAGAVQSGSTIADDDPDPYAPAAAAQDGGKDGKGDGGGARPRASVAIAVGGHGGVAGQGGLVDAGNSGLIATRGDQRTGVLLQSVGGGGGSGAYTAGGASGGEIGVNVLLGGAGGAGGDGGRVRFEHTGTVRTEGARAHALLAQSIGGGGGTGGAAQASTSVNLAVGGGAGGHGGAGGSGGRVEITHAGALSTTGAMATGATVQSIGGGGGQGGASAIRMRWTPGSPIVQIPLMVASGGNGGASGGGGTVQWSQGEHGEVRTLGNDAHAVRLQSIGGGGGVAVVSGQAAKGDAAPVDADDAPAFELLAMSSGGRGGVTGSGGAVDAALDAGAVLSSAGARSVGLFAQSVGGGGGVSGFADPDARWRKASLDVGGATGVQGDGGVVTVTHAGLAATQGGQAHGIFAQSVGGGGGVGTAAGGSAVASTLNAQGGGKGRGGDVSVAVGRSGDVATAGDGAIGVLAQSVGGGGGYASSGSLLDFRPADAAGTAGTRGGAGEGGAVAVDVAGRVATTGRHAAAVLAQSVGGGGGIVEERIGAAANTAASGSGGPVSVRVSGGTVAAFGENSPGIYAQSVHRAGERSRIAVTVGGQVQGGTGAQAAGIVLSGGYRNTVTLEAGSRVGGLNGQAIRAEGAAVAVTTHGLLQGSVDLGRAAGHSLSNEQSGVFEPGELIGLNGGRLRNAGRLAPGGAERYQSTRLQGDFVQEASGVYAPKVDFAGGLADRLDVSGAASLDGRLAVNGVNHQRDATATVLTAQSLALQPGFVSTPSPVYTYPVRVVDGRTLRVGVEADFTGAAGALSEDQRDFAAYVDRRWNEAPAGTPGALVPVFDTIALAGSRQAYADVIDSLANDALQAPAVQLPVTAQGFTSRMMSCPGFGPGADAGLRERDCFWGRIKGREVKRSETGSDTGFRMDSVTMQFGGQKQVAPGWFAGGSVAYEESRGKAYSVAQRTTGDAFSAGVVLKRQQGPWLFAGALSGGYGKYDTHRTLATSLGGQVASSDWKAYFAAARLQASYTHAVERYYIKPSLELDVIHHRVPGYVERGAGAFDLALDSASRTTAMLSPAVELGGRFDIDGGTLRPYLSLGASLASNRSWQVDARFANDPSQDRFRLEQRLPRAYVRVKAGVELVRRNGFELKAEISQRSGSGYTERAGELRMAVRF